MKLSSTQFSLATMLAVVTLGCVMLSVFRLVPWPDFGAVHPAVWGGCAMVCGIAAASVFGIRCLNS